MNEVVKIGSYEDDDNYGSEKGSKHHSSAAPFQRQLLSIPSKSRGLVQSPWDSKSSKQ